jgi:DNA-binding FadR family transcriptional regulator
MTNDPQRSGASTLRINPAEPAEKSETLEVVFGSVKHGKLAEVVAAQIRNEIHNGHLSLGDKLPSEKELIEQLGVSRATVREALTLLESDGFVSVRSGRYGGAYVTQPRVERLSSILDTILTVEKTTMEELLEARALLEPLAVRQAAQKATPEDLERIEASIERMEENRNDPTIVAAEAARYHILIAEATHNGVISTLTTIMQNLIFARLFETLGSEADDTIKAHRSILRAIRNGEADVAAKRMAHHISAFEEVLDDSETQGLTVVTPNKRGAPRNKPVQRITPKKQLSPVDRVNGLSL